MPLTKGPQIKEKVISLKREHPEMSITEIAREAGCSHGTVTWHLGKAGLGPLPPSKKSRNSRKGHYDRSKAHHFNEQDVRAVRNLMNRGMKQPEIREETGLSKYAVWKAAQIIKNEKIQKPVIEVSNGKIVRAPNKLQERAFKLRQSGLSLRAVAAKLGVPDGTASSAYYAYIKKTNGEAKGVAIIHHHGNTTNTADSNGNGATEEGPTKGELIGYAWAQIERNVATISEGISLNRDILRRRLSKLLAFEALR